MTDTTTTGVGPLLRDWRRRRRLSQLDLALEAGVSARHVSFLETGRSNPSREMVLHLAEQLAVPLRDRNHLLMAAGFAPVYTARELDDPEMGPVREALELVLRAHEPYPALVVDTHWELIQGNAGLGVLTDGCAAHLLEPPVNVLRLALHPDGMAARTVNLASFRAHLLERLGRQIALTGDPQLMAMREEALGFPAPEHDGGPTAIGDIAVPLVLRAPGGGDGVLSLFSTMSTFGTAVDITLAELSIESFFPADAATARALRG